LPQQQENMMTGAPALQPDEYLRRLFDDVEFSYLVVVAAQLGVADILASGLGRSLTSLRPLVPMLSRCIASCEL
jgi:hypothetical protein